MKVWWTAAELAAAGLPGLPASKRGVQLVADREGWAHGRNERGDALVRPRQGRGGGTEFHVTLLPQVARAALEPATVMAQPLTSTDRWAAFERLPETKKAEARRRLEILHRVEALAANGARTAAVLTTCAERTAKGERVSPATVYEWFKLVEGLDKSDRITALAPRHQGGKERVDIDDDLLAAFRSDWLRPEQPTFEACYRRTARIAKSRGLEMPSLSALRRRMTKVVSPLTITYLRQGPDALKAAYPHQVRDRSAFRACEAYVADTHTWDVMVRWPDGTIARPAQTAVQDLASNKMVGWRFARSESSDVVRLAFADAFRNFGICDAVYLDNGRAFASKLLTGGQANRYRFKHNPEDPNGMLTSLGVKVHWTKPYSGQSKPIERSFRDFASDIAKHPAFAGAYTGNSPGNKPSNYGERAVDLDVFIDVAVAEIHAWNARPGRRTAAAQGASFDDVFAASYAEGPIRRATSEQLRLCLLAAEARSPNSRDGSIWLGRNRYWTDGLAALIGQKVMVRFDPDALHSDVYVYDQAGRFVLAAPCVEETGFATAEEGRRHERARTAWMRAQKAIAELERTMSAARLAAMQIDVRDAAPEPIDSPNVVRPHFAGNAAFAALPRAEAEPDTLSFNDRMRLAEQRRAERLESHLRLITNE